MKSFMSLLSTSLIVICSAPLLAQQAIPVPAPVPTPTAAPIVAPTPTTSPSPKPPEPSRGIEYATPQAALDALRKRTDVEIGVQKKWLVIRDNPNKAIWTFAPPDHPAYPAVIKRMVSNKDGNEKMETSALCQAKREACDAMMKDVRAMDEKMRPTLQKTMPKKQLGEAGSDQAQPASPQTPPAAPLKPNGK